MRERDYYYEQEVDFDGIEITIEKVNGIGITRMEDETGDSYFKGSDVVNLLKVFNDVPKSFTIGKIINADLLFDIDGVLKYDEKTNKATKYSPYWLTLEALDNAFEESRYNTEYVFETLNLLNELVDWADRHEFLYEEKHEVEVVEDKLDVNDKYGTVMTSRLLAQQLCKEHKHVRETIRKILGSSSGREYTPCYIPSVFKDSRGVEHEEYLLTKDGFTLYMFNIQGYLDFKIEYIKRFNEMERHMSELVQIETQKRVRELEKENQLLRISAREKNAKKLLEKYADDPVSYTATEVAKEINENVVEMNRWLAKLGVQYREGNSWMINDKYSTNGFTVVRTYRTRYGEKQTYTRWTKKGKEFIHSLYRNHSALDLVS